MHDFAWMHFHFSIWFIGWFLELPRTSVNLKELIQSIGFQRIFPLTHTHAQTNFVFFSLGIFPFCLCCTQSHLIMVAFTHNLKGCFRKNGLLKSKQIKWQKRAKMEAEKDGKSACKRLKGSSHRNDYVLSSNDHRLCTASNVLSHVLLSTQNKSAAKFSTQKCIRISILTEYATHTNGDWRQDRTARHAQTPCARNEL